MLDTLTKTRWSDRASFVLVAACLVCPASCVIWRFNPELLKSIGLLKLCLLAIGSTLPFFLLNLLAVGIFADQRSRPSDVEAPDLLSNAALAAALLVAPIYAPLGLDVLFGILQPWSMALSVAVLTGLELAALLWFGSVTSPDLSARDLLYSPLESTGSRWHG